MNDRAHPARGPRALAAALGVELDPIVLKRALTHRSYAYEHGRLPTNERLEFLGDSVLALVVTEALFRDNPAVPEGQLAKMRAAVVNRTTLAEVARSLDLGSHLLLGRGEQADQGWNKDSILADGLEAVLGAVYLSLGLPGATAVVQRLFADRLAEAPARGAGLDWKTSLQEFAAAYEHGPITYEIRESGPDHQKQFVAFALVRGERLGCGQGTSKKQAEQVAAAQALAVLQGDGERPSAETTAAAEPLATAPAAAEPPAAVPSGPSAAEPVAADPDGARAALAGSDSPPGPPHRVAADLLAARRRPDAGTA